MRKGGYTSELPQMASKTRLTKMKVLFGALEVDCGIPSDYQYKGDTYRIVGDLGSGRFSTVYKASRNGRDLVAVKIQRFLSPTKDNVMPQRPSALIPAFTGTGMVSVPYKFDENHSLDNISSTEREERQRCLQETQNLEIVRERCRDPQFVGDLHPVEFTDFFVDHYGSTEFLIPIVPSEAKDRQKMIVDGFYNDIPTRTNPPTRIMDYQFIIRIYFSIFSLCDASANDRIEIQSNYPRVAHFPLTDRITASLQVQHALEIMRRCGVIHSDIKAANILLQNGRWKLADFGISSLRDAGFPSTNPTISPPRAVPGSSRALRTKPRTSQSQGTPTSSLGPVQSHTKANSDSSIPSSSDGDISTQVACDLNMLLLNPTAPDAHILPPNQLLSSSLPTMPSSFAHESDTSSSLSGSDTSVLLAMERAMEMQMSSSSPDASSDKHDDAYYSKSGYRPGHLQNADLTCWMILLLQLITLKTDAVFEKWQEEEAVKFQQSLQLHAGSPGLRVEIDTHIADLLQVEARQYPGLDSFIDACLFHSDERFEPMNSPVYMTWRSILDPSFGIVPSQLHFDGILMFISKQEVVSDEVFDKMLLVLRRMVDENAAAFSSLIQDIETINHIFAILVRRYDSEMSKVPVESTKNAFVILDRCLSYLERSRRYDELRQLQQYLFIHGYVIDFITRIIQAIQDGSNIFQEFDQGLSSANQLDSNPNLKLSMGSSSHIPRDVESDAQQKSKGELSSSSSSSRPPMIFLPDVMYLVSSVAMLLCVNNATYSNLLFRLAEKSKIQLDFLMDQFMRYQDEAPYESFYTMLLALSAAGEFSPTYMKRPSDDIIASMEKKEQTQLYARLNFIGDQLASILGPSFTLRNPDSARKFAAFVRVFATGAIKFGHQSFETNTWEFKNVRHAFLGKCLPRAILILSKEHERVILAEKVPEIDWTQIYGLVSHLLVRHSCFESQNWNQSFRDICLNRIRYKGQIGSLPLVQWAMKVNSNRTFCACSSFSPFPSTSTPVGILGTLLCLRCAEAYHATCLRCAESNMVPILTGPFACSSSLSPISPTNLGSDDQFPDCCGWKRPIEPYLLPTPDFAHVTFKFGRIPSFMHDLGKDPSQKEKALLWDHDKIANASEDGQGRHLAIEIHSTLLSEPPKLPPGFFAKPDRLPQGEMIKYVEIKMSKPTETWLGFSSNKLFTIAACPELEKLSSISVPFLAYNTMNGNLMYSSVVDSTGKMIIRSRPYGHPLDTTHRLGMGITSKRIYFIINSVALPLITFESLIAFPAQEFIDLLSSPPSGPGTVVITMSPGSCITLRPYWEGKLLTHAHRLSSCPFIPKAKKLAFDLQNQFKAVSEVDPSLTKWLGDTIPHYRQHHPEMLQIPPNRGHTSTPSSSSTSRRHVAASPSVPHHAKAQPTAHTANQAQTSNTSTNATSSTASSSHHHPN